MRHILLLENTDYLPVRHQMDMSMLEGNCTEDSDGKIAGCISVTLWVQSNPMLSMVIRSMVIRIAPQTRVVACLVTEGCIQGVPGLLWRAAIAGAAPRCRLPSV